MVTTASRERTIEAAARWLADGEIVLVGVGDPSIAAWRARESHATELQLVYESGAIGSVPETSPLSIGDPTLVAQALATMSVADMFDLVIGGGRIDTAFVGAAQIDRRGCLNSTVVGTYDAPKVRLPGSGGAVEILHGAKRVLVMSPLERRRFPERVDFVSSRPRATSELVVVTDRAVLARRPGEEELALVSLMPGETVEGIRAEVQWDLRISDDIDVERVQQD
jgi:glutaconate CoA-transferase, subunit B